LFAKVVQMMGVAVAAAGFLRALVKESDFLKDENCKNQRLYNLCLDNVYSLGYI
jgi:hypothetical protein